MRKLFLSLLMVSLTTAPALAQNSGAGTATRPGRTKIWIGSSLVAAGALLIPLTAVDGSTSNTKTEAGLVLMSAGGAVLLWGLYDRRQLTRPATSVGVGLGRRMSFFVCRRW